MEMKINDYRDLVVWQKSMNLVERIYLVTKEFPNEEKYVLVSQMRRSVISIPSNIAEGQRRGSRKDYARFVYIAYGSGAEIETQIEIAHRLGYISEQNHRELFSLLQEIMKMLNVLERRLSKPITY